jgi:orotidine-5'-phosphate decarboxylase
VTQQAPIAVALDAPDLSTAVDWAAAVAAYVSTLKVGLELFDRHGHQAVTAIRTAAPAAKLFLDVKLHDIPATVRGAARSLAALEPDYLTVHCLGGRAMVEAAVRELPATRIAGVTVLTSLSQDDLETLGVAGPPLDAVRRLAAVAVEAGARALVCSPQEVATVRSDVGPEITLITPGVRPVGDAARDQARVASPHEALAAGADLLVIGRPITAAEDPGAAAAALAAALGNPRGTTHDAKA